MSNAGSKVQPRRRIMRALKINEISGVDVPAQEGAKALLLKRQPPTEAPTEKRAWLTTDVDGHAHLVDEVDYDGRYRDAGTTSWSTSEGEDDGHSHPWVRTPEGKIVIGASEGHTHETVETSIKAATAAPKGEEKMTTKQEPAAPTAEQQLAAMQKQLATVTAIAGLSDAEKAHYNGLDDSGKEKFLAKSAADRASELDAIRKATEDKDPVMYTSTDGVAYRKSAGEGMIALAKSNDRLRKDLEESTKRIADADVRKRAETELKHLPGDVDARIALIKAVDSIADKDSRAKAQAALAAQNTAFAAAFKTAGTGAAPNAEDGSPIAELDALAKAHAETNKVSQEVAYAAVLGTEKGAQLYAKSVQN